MTLSSEKHLTWKEILFLPFGCLMQASMGPVLLLITAIAICGFIITQTFNTDLFGIAAPDLAGLQVSSDFHTISDTQGRNWTLDLQTNQEVQYSGLVRHITPDHIINTPFLTHDILVTTGDFSNPHLVRTTVFNHHFFWVSNSEDHPNGTINLLHTVVFNQDIYEQIMHIRSGMTIQVHGYEIGAVNVLDENGRRVGSFVDSGCNTFLVTSINIETQSE